jgi:ABC-type transport system involved in cytochrome c biogenesis permease component
MPDGARALVASAALELRQLARSRALVAFTMLEALTFLILVSLFGLTGSRAPTALINEDHGPLAASFITYLERAHHSFQLRDMSASDARHQLATGQLVAAITIPVGFGADVTAGRTVVLPVDVDNVDVDLTDDIERAVPSALAAFGRANGFTGIRVAAQERDLIAHDTGFIPYLVVSALALDAMVVAGVLGAVAMTREFEARTFTQWHLAPVRPAWLLAGKLAAPAAVSTAAISVAAAVVFAGYGITPVHAVATFAALALCVAIFTCVGAATGALLRRSLPVAALFFGLALPLYIDSGALEPERFDGNVVWAIAHASPVYFAVGALEDAVHGLRVTPEPPLADVAVLLLWAVVSVLVASAVLSRRVSVR